MAGDKPISGVPNGAQSHRESQRYFSRPSDEPNLHPTSLTKQKITIKQDSRNKHLVTNQSQSSKERKKSKQIAEKELGSRGRGTNRFSNSSTRGGGR